ncbi:MAG: hypothetical protein V3R99_04860 [Thermoguttaceae bacterium]
MKRVTLTLVALGVLSVAAGQAMAAGLKVRSSRGIPILGQASSRAYDSSYRQSSRQCPPGCGCARHSRQGSHHGSSRYQSPYYGRSYVRPPSAVYPGMYGRSPYYSSPYPYYASPYRSLYYSSRGISFGIGF